LPPSLGYKAGKRVRRKVTGRTKREVKAKLRDLRRDLESGVRPSATYTVGAALDDWLANGLSDRSDRTKELYRDTVKPLKQRLGQVKLRELTAGDVQETLDTLAARLSTRSLQITRLCLAGHPARRNPGSGRPERGGPGQGPCRTGRRRRAGGSCRCRNWLYGHCVSISTARPGTGCWLAFSGKITVLSSLRLLAPLDRHNVLREFRKITKAAGLGTDWVPREMRHTFVSLLSSNGTALEDIADLVGHRGTTTTETVYRKVIVPELRRGAEVMDRLFI
jgi:hypothetical protein